MTKEELIKTLEEYDKEVNRLYKENKQLKENINKALRHIGLIMQNGLCDFSDIEVIEKYIKGSEENESN